jgi:hypothetical protein
MLIPTDRRIVIPGPLPHAVLLVKRPRPGVRPTPQPGVLSQVPPSRPTLRRSVWHLAIRADFPPSSYTLPIHSALVDFIGQLLLMLAYELCIFQGKDVLVKDV